MYAHEYILTKYFFSRKWLYSQRFELFRNNYCLHISVSRVVWLTLVGLSNSLKVLKCFPKYMRTAYLINISYLHQSNKALCWKSKITLSRYSFQVIVNRYVMMKTASKDPYFNSRHDNDDLSLFNHTCWNYDMHS